MEHLSVKTPESQTAFLSDPILDQSDGLWLELQTLFVVEMGGAPGGARLRAATGRAGSLPLRWALAGVHALCEDTAPGPQILLHRTLLLHFLRMMEPFLNLAKGLLPNGICEYSIRRHEYMRCGFSSARASRMALSLKRYRMFGDSRLNLLPREISGSLRTCVDAGAHAGNWTAALLDLFFPERVIALECEPRMVDGLKSKFRSVSHVNIVDAALAAGSGTTTLYQLQHPASSSLLRPRAEIGKEYQLKSWDVINEVSVTTVGYDELVAFEPEISILKLDIQGSEMDVLTHSSEGLKKTKSVILEVLFTSHYHRDSVFPDLHEVMVRKGFGLYRLSEAYHRGGRALFADAVYVREDVLRELAIR
jgi:FkbM family methyltransferase